MIEISKIVPLEILDATDIKEYIPNKIPFTASSDPIQLKSEIEAALFKDNFCVLKTKNVMSKGDYVSFLDSLFKKKILQTRDINSFVMPVKPMDNSPKIIYSSKHQSFHVDCGDNNYQPNFAILVCLKSAEIGGLSLIVPNEKIIEFIKKSNLNPEEIEALYASKSIIYERGNISFTSSIVHKNASGESCFSIRYADRMTGKTLLYEELLYKLLVFVHNRVNHYRFLLETGEILILNNNKVLHGRNSFKGERELMRIWYDGIM